MIIRCDITKGNSNHDFENVWNIQKIWCFDYDLLFDFFHRWVNLIFDNKVNWKKSFVYKMQRSTKYAFWFQLQISCTFYSNGIISWNHTRKSIFNHWLITNFLLQTKFEEHIIMKSMTSTFCFCSHHQFITFHILFKWSNFTLGIRTLFKHFMAHIPR